MPALTDANPVRLSNINARFARAEIPLFCSSKKETLALGHPVEKNILKMNFNVNLNFKKFLPFAKFLK